MTTDANIANALLKINTAYHTLRSIIDSVNCAKTEMGEDFGKLKHIDARLCSAELMLAAQEAELKNEITSRQSPVTTITSK